MCDLFVFILICWGLTDVVVVSSLLKPFRTFVGREVHYKLGELLDCHQCVGFWVGGLVALAGHGVVFSWGSSHWGLPAYLFFDGLIASGVVCIIQSVLVAIAVDDTKSSS